MLPRRPAGPPVVIHRAVSRITASVDTRGATGTPIENGNEVMGKSRSFKFVDESLNQQLLTLLKKRKIQHEVDKQGLILYSPEDEEVVENDVIGAIRDKVFPS